MDSAESSSLSSTRLCNGLSELCARRINQINFPATHNSMSSAEDSWSFPNHSFNIKSQLDAGIRGLNLDTHLWNEQAYLCHSFCSLGALPLVEGLRIIEEFLSEYPNELIVITFQSGISAELTMQAFEESSLDKRLYHHELGSEWPVLKDLLDANKQVIAFSSNDTANLNGYLPQWTHWIDNPYAAEEIDDFSCVEDRGDPSTASLFNVNHFITAPLANIDNSREANQYDILREHVQRCWEETGRFPNQILVDFYAEGALFEVSKEINLAFSEE